MSIEIKNYIKSKITEFDPEIDVQEGSVVNDLVISPLAYVLNTYDEINTAILSTLSFSDVENMSESLLDIIAKQYLITRGEGQKAEGEIYIYLSKPSAITIEKNFIFTTKSGLEFIVTSDFFLTKAAVSTLLQYPYYKVGPISVIAAEVGEVYNIQEGTLFDTSIKTSITPVMISAGINFYNGVNYETNTELYERIKLELYGTNLSSPKAIKSALSIITPTIAAINVIGQGSPYMTRDLISDAILKDSYKNFNYLYAVSGMHTNIYDNKNIAYFLNYEDNGDLPSIDSDFYEFTNEQYQGLYYKNTNEYSEIKKTIILSGIGNFTEGIKADSFLGGALINSNEISITDDTLTLGYSNDVVNNVILNVNTLSTALADPELLTSFIQNSISQINLNNYSPVVSKSISQKKGVSILCKGSTSDATEVGELAYITVGRNKNVPAAHDGYGIAWRKQPAFLVRMQKNTYASTSQRVSDLTTFYEEYGVDGTQYLGNIKSYPEYWKYNLFLVDNDILTEDLFITKEMFLDQTSGKNQFLQATKVWIEDGLDSSEYWFRLDIDRDGATKIWVGEDYTSFNDSNILLNRGSNFNSYTLEEGYLDGVLTNDAVRTHFGIGVLQTKGSIWHFKNLEITSIVDTKPLSIFSFYVQEEDYTLQNKLNFAVYGIGYLNTLDSSKLQVYAYNFNTALWQKLGNDDINTSFNLNSLNTIKLERVLENPANYIYNNRCYFAVTCPDINSTLRIYYTELDNAVTHQVHRGNCTDIYCYDPKNITTSKVVQYVVNNKVTLSEPYIFDIISIKENITQFDISRENYTISALNSSDSYSKKNVYEIYFSPELEGAEIAIEFSKWSKGLSTSAQLITGDNRFPTSDILLKTAPGIIININNLSYKGGLSLNEMKIKIKDYINSITDGRFDKSDLINTLYTNGATYVSLDMDISLKCYDAEFNYTEFTLIDDYYDVSEHTEYKLSYFYTKNEFLYGVNKS
jgi:hypothetical protein